MLLSIVCFTVNTLAVRAISHHFPDCNGWQVTLFRGLAGTLVVLAFFSKGRNLRLRSLLDRPKIIWRGILGATGVAIFYITIIHLGPARSVVINLSYPVFAALLASLFLSKHLGFMKLTWILIGLAGASLTLLATFMVNRQTSKPLLKMPSKPTPIHDNH